MNYIIYFEHIDGEHFCIVQSSWYMSEQDWRCNESCFMIPPIGWDCE